MKRLTFEQFEKYINILKEDEAYYNALSDVFRKFNNDSELYPSGKINDAVVELIEYIFDDEMRVFSYWVYDCFMGEFEARPYDKENGVEIPFKTTEDVYKLLCALQDGLKIEW